MQKYKIIVNTNIDRDLSSESKTNVTCYLSRPVSAYRSNVNIGVRKVALPNTAYNFRPTETNLYYTVDGTLKNITIDYDRYYDKVADDLVPALNSLFTANSDDIVVSQDADTKRLIFTNNTGVDVRLVSDYIYETEVGGTQLVKHANQRLGLTSDMTSTTIPNGSSLHAPSLPRLGNSLVWHVLCRDLGDQTITTTPSPNDNPKVLCTVLNDQSFGSTITKEIADDSIFFFRRHNDIDKFSLEIVDDEFRPVHFNGAPAYIELEYYYS